MKEQEKEKFSTKIINKRFSTPDAHGALSMPIYSNAAFEFETSKEMRDAFLGITSKHTYTRSSNPTVEFFEQRVKAVSGAEYVTAVASGMAAISGAIFAIAYAGANIVTTTHLFGNTYSLFYHTLQAFGVETRFCDLLNTEDLKKNIDENTCTVFTEAITNPHMEVADLKKISELAKEKKVPLIVDTTLVPWSEWNAGAFGADIEVVSSTKYISGGATSIGGLVLDHNTYDWKNSKKLNAYADADGKNAFHRKYVFEINRNIGACMSPQVAFLQNLGLESMEVRYRKESATCLELAKFLKTVPNFEDVRYPGLEDSPFFQISTSQFGSCPGAMLTFGYRDQSTCYRFMDKLKVIRRATNLFDNKSLIIHPLSTIYGTLPQSDKEKINIPDNMMRLSVGLEDFEDLKNDLLQALD